MLVLLGCAAQVGGPQTSEKDTGYLGEHSVELEAIFESSIAVSPGQPLLTGARPLNEYQTPADLNLDVVAFFGNKQFAFIHRQLAAREMHINLADFEVLEASAAPENPNYRLFFRARVSLVAEHRRLVPELLGETITTKLPTDPFNGLYALLIDGPTHWTDCAVDASSSLIPDNYFYYFEPTADCEELVALTEANLTIERELPAPVTYPEYDRLLDDEVVDIAVLFGANGIQEDGSVSDDDASMREYRSFVADMLEMGFQEQGVADPLSGLGLELGKITDGIRYQMSVFSSQDIPRVDGEDHREAIQRIQSEHEVVYFSGHSEYGALSWFESPETFGLGLYQIFVFRACHSYSYYTSRILRHKRVSQADPWRDIDVVNTLEAASFSSRPNRLFFEELLFGLETAARDLEAPSDWAAIIDRMNDASNARWGVSGVSANHYRPRNE